ncbi:aminoglycoside phosphotransferase (APT) family kinase protein [Deinococcus yavapaiensis KR-236]|uniref:Aminoglycoside phosphotransferase (APT) family kinase protein n=2 Tax=Deinococcus TaxID=1298 RepID=A0A318SCI1_9DEIO|nr:aminoglycoside phosphotransferase (APT) family kinase protein [Deinococcus yavapaiensis KR-236]
MPESFPSRALHACFPGHAALEARLGGEGDDCVAFHVRTDAEWMFLRAKHPHASACLDRLAALAPDLAAHLPVAVPAVEHHGRIDGHAFVGYRAVSGEFLSHALERGLDATRLRRAALDFANFFRALHALDPEPAKRVNVPSSDYAFGMRDEGWEEGDAASLYARDLEAYRKSRFADADTVTFLTQALDRHLTTLEDGAAHVLLHGEVSPGHVLLNEDGHLHGIIDFNGMYVGRSARDFLYLYETFGRRWTSDLLVAYESPDVTATLDELRFLHVWHTLLRLMWAVEHGLADLAARRSADLETLRNGLRPD